MPGKYFVFKKKTNILYVVLTNHVDDFFSSDTSYVNLSPMQKTLKRIEGIRKICGDLCDTSKEINPGDFLGYVTSKVKTFNNRRE